MERKGLQHTNNIVEVIFEQRCKEDEMRSQVAMEKRIPDIGKNTHGPEIVAYPGV